MKTRPTITILVFTELKEKEVYYRNKGNEEMAKVISDCATDLLNANEKLERDKSPENIALWKDHLTEAIDYLQPYE